MKNITFILLALAWFIASCKPGPAPQPDDREPPKQYSYWVVNEDSFSTNDVTLDIGKAESRVGNNENNWENNFSIGFDIGYALPKSGSFPISHGQGNASTVGINFYYQGVLFIISEYNNGYLVASSVNNKARYTLSPTWFVNYYNHNDSVLIHGVFNEP